MNAFACITSLQVAAQTLTLLRSLVATHSLDSAICYVLCLDSQVADLLFPVIDKLPIKLLTIVDIPEIEAFSKRPISRYAVACKPFLLDWIFTHTDVNKILYFDSDTWIYSDMSGLFELLDHSKILIVPFIVEAEATIKNWASFARNAQRTGFYNAGFIGCHRRSQDFLAWWKNRCAYSTFRDFYEDISGDQKYLNWVPLLFSDVHIVRHHGVNVKWWQTQYYVFNRNERGIPTLNEDPILFFHFSQSLGYLVKWNSEFMPEVAQYLAELERSQRDLNLPYIDMSLRDNSELILPLIPRIGFEARVLIWIKRLRLLRSNIYLGLIRGRAMCFRLLSFGSGARIALLSKYISHWPLHDDCNLKITPYVAAYSSKQVYFLGISCLAFSLAYWGHQVTVEEPFQGYYNSKLKRLFNPQFPLTTAIVDKLAIEGRLSLSRRPIDGSTYNNEPALFVMASRDLEFVLPALTRLVPIARTLIVIFGHTWDTYYQQEYIAEILERFPTLTFRDEVDSVTILENLPVQGSTSSTTQYLEPSEHVKVAL